MSTVTNKLNQILANSNVMFTKLHNYHWNIKGMQFMPIHLKTEESYNYFSQVYDDTAERVLQLGGSPLITLKQILEESKIEEDSNSVFDATYVITNMVKDYELFLKDFKELSNIAEGDATTSAYADDQVSILEKEIWILKSHIS